MLFLLPPSESKVRGGGSLNISQVALTFGALNPAREQVLQALEALCRDEAAAIRALKLTPKSLADLAENLSLREAPTMPALSRYSGTLYEAIHSGLGGECAPLNQDAWTRAKRSVLIQSSLFGLVPATDLIPYYRLSSSSSLPGLRLADVWAAAHEPVFSRIDQGLVIDLRSKAYAALAPIPSDVPSAWVEVVSRESDGALRALNHFNKQAKGLLVRAVLMAEKAPESVADLAEIAESIGMELRADQSGDQLTLITAQVKKGDLPR